MLAGIAASREELEQYLTSTLTSAEDFPPQSTEDFVRRALVDAAEELVGQTVDRDYASFEPDDRFIELELPGQVEELTIDYVEADPDTVQWQVYESFDGTTLLLEASILASLTFIGLHRRVSLWSRRGSRLLNGTGNDHVSQVTVDRRASLKFQVRVEEGVGVDHVEFESAEPLFENTDRLP